MAPAPPVRPFADPARRPADETLAAELGPSVAAFHRLLALAIGYACDWQFAGKSGWMLKVHARAKALCYVIPLAGSFRVSMAIRENERASLIADPEFEALHDSLAAARRAAEGYALAFDVTGPEPAPVERLVARLVTLRA